MSLPEWSDVRHVTQRCAPAERAHVSAILISATAMEVGTLRSQRHNGGRIVLAVSSCSTATLDRNAQKSDVLARLTYRAPSQDPAGGTYVELDA